MYTVFHKRVGLDPSITSVKVKVYDVEKKELIAEYDSVRAASRATGVPPTTISRYIRLKHRSYKNNLNRTICFR